MPQIQHIFPKALWLLLTLHTLTSCAQQGDGGSAEGDSNSNLGDSGNGADGSSRSSANLSKGAIIGIAVVVGLVVIIGGKHNHTLSVNAELTIYVVTLAVLFYLAKKRQWKVRETIRRTTTRVVRAMTPRNATFGKDALKSPKMNNTKQGRAFIRKPGDVEKGFQSIDEQVADRTSEEQDLKKQKKKSPPANLQPSSHFEMDSPKSPMWTRVFGRT